MASYIVRRDVRSNHGNGNNWADDRRSGTVIGDCGGLPTIERTLWIDQ